jgi:hypothetical protein
MTIDTKSKGQGAKKNEGDGDFTYNNFYCKILSQVKGMNNVKEACCR